MRKLLVHPKPGSIIHKRFMACGCLYGPHRVVWAELIDAKGHVQHSKDFRIRFCYQEIKDCDGKIEVLTSWLMVFIDLDQKVGPYEFRLYSNVDRKNPQVVVPRLEIRGNSGGLQIDHPESNTQTVGPMFGTYGTTNQTPETPIECCRLKGPETYNSQNIIRVEDFWGAAFDNVSESGTYQLDVHHASSCTGGDTKTGIEFQ